MGPNFCYTIENISFWGCRKQEMVQSDRRMTSILINLRSGVLLIHGEERVQTSSKQLILIWDSILSSKVHHLININWFNMHIVDKYMKTCILQMISRYNIMSALPCATCAYHSCYKIWGWGWGWWDVRTFSPIHVTSAYEIPRATVSEISSKFQWLYSVKSWTWIREYILRQKCLSQRSPLNKN